MHAWGRLTSGAAIASAVLVSAGSPAGADSWEPPDSGSFTDQGGFNAWSFWVSHNGAGAETTVQTCEFPPSLWPPGGPLPSHIEYWVDEVLPGEFLVWEYCVIDDEIVDRWTEAIPRERWDPWAVVEWPQEMWTATAAEPEDLLAMALAHLDPEPPAIGTSPGGDVASMVGIPTWFWLQGGVQPVSETITDGPLAVTVTATPVGVSWDTGDGGQAVCTDEAHVGVPDTGTCSHTYERSSLGQAGRDASGRPAYTVAAEIEYVGGYQVTLWGQPAGGQADIGGVARVSEVDLAVNEAQAVNRPTRG